MGIVRQPRAWLNGIAVISCEVHVSSRQEAHTFEAVMALDDPSNPGAAYWSNTAPIPATIVATDGTNTKTLITGNVLLVDIDFEQRVVRVTGQDKTQDLISRRNDQKYPNMTTADVVSAIAGQHGLSVQSDGGTDMAGHTFNNQDYAFNSDVENDWDVVQACAEQDGKVAFIHGNTLFYSDPGNAQGSTFAVTYVPPTSESYEQGTTMKLSCSRDVPIAEGVQAECASWHQHDKRAYTSASGRR